MISGEKPQGRIIQGVIFFAKNGEMVSRLSSFPVKAAVDVSVHNGISNVAVITHRGDVGVFELFFAVESRALSKTIHRPRGRG